MLNAVPSTAITAIGSAEKTRLIDQERLPDEITVATAARNTTPGRCISRSISLADQVR